MLLDATMFTIDLRSTLEDGASRRTQHIHANALFPTAACALSKKNAGHQTGVK
jgi:hypothetical protein